MNDLIDDYRTPGQYIEKLLAERDWSKEFLSFLLSVSPTIVSRVLAGTRSIDAQMALDLGEVFGVEPEVFLRLQQSYDLAMARVVTKPNPERATRANLFGHLPVREMIKRGWLNVENPKDVEAVEGELMRFFRVDDLNDIEILPHAAKKTNVEGSISGAQLVWLYRVRQMAEDQMVATYSDAAMRKAIKELEPLMISPDGVRKVPRVLENAGVRFVICESTKSAKIDGVSFWLDSESPVIGMSLRYDRIDNFWFVLRHECEHVLQHHGRDEDTMMLDTELEQCRENVSEEERIADLAAANFGVTQDALQRFIRRKEPFFREQDLLGFARTEAVHPGIVVGRLQRAIGRFDLLRQHLVKIRSRIVQDVIVDGWGETAPVDY